jgi:hypothetical protein
MHGVPFPHTRTFESQQACLYYKPYLCAQTLHLHIGGDLQIPVRDNKYAMPASQHQEQQRKDPFEGLPLRAWAEKLGERVMPAYELIQEEQRAVKQAAKAMQHQVQELHVPEIPHLLPFTRWCDLSSCTSLLNRVDQFLCAVSIACPFTTMGASRSTSCPSTDDSSSHSLSAYPCP